MLEGQKHQCAICSVSFDETKPHVDHCHETGKIRGLLCNRCNSMLAALDREGFMDKAMKYINDSSEGGGN
jgi:hypothetical protein